MFWRLTLREIDIILTGVSKRLIQERNLAMEAAWHTARLTAYAPEKGRDFTKLKDMLYREKSEKVASDWQDKLAEVQSWVSGFKGRGTG